MADSVNLAELAESVAQNKERLAKVEEDVKGVKSKLEEMDKAIKKVILRVENNEIIQRGHNLRVRGLPPGLTGRDFRGTESERLAEFLRLFGQLLEKGLGFSPERCVDMIRGIENCHPVGGVVWIVALRRLDRKEILSGKMKLSKGFDFGHGPVYIDIDRTGAQVETDRELSHWLKEAKKHLTDQPVKRGPKGTVVIGGQRMSLEDFRRKVKDAGGEEPAGGSGGAGRKRKGPGKGNGPPPKK